MPPAVILPSATASVLTGAATVPAPLSLPFVGSHTATFADGSGYDAARSVPAFAPGSAVGGWVGMVLPASSHVVDGNGGEG